MLFKKRLGNSARFARISMAAMMIPPTDVFGSTEKLVNRHHSLDQCPTAIPVEEWTSW